MNISDDAQIFQVDTVVGADTTVPIEPMLDEFLLRVYMIYNNVSVMTLTRREDADLIILVHLLEHFMRVWSDIEVGPHLLSIRRSNHEANVRLALGFTTHTMRQSLIEVEQQELLDAQLALREI